MESGRSGKHLNSLKLRNSLFFIDYFEGVKKKVNIECLLMKKKLLEDRKKGMVCF